MHEKTRRSVSRASISECLRIARLNLDELDFVVFYDESIEIFMRFLETHIAYAPFGLRAFCESMDSWLSGKRYQKQRVLRELKQTSPQVDWNSKLFFSDHHLRHAASAFYPPPFESAVILTMDGVGE